MRFWDSGNGNELRKEEIQKGINCIAFSPNGKNAVCGDELGTIRTFSIPDAKLVRQLEGQNTGVVCLAYSPDGKTLGSAGEDEAWSSPRKVDTGLMVIPP